VGQQDDNAEIERFVSWLEDQLRLLEEWEESLPAEYTNALDYYLSWWISSLRDRYQPEDIEEISPAVLPPREATELAKRFPPHVLQHLLAVLRRSLDRLLRSGEELTMALIQRARREGWRLVRMIKRRPTYQLVLAGLHFVAAAQLLYEDTANGEPTTVRDGLLALSGGVAWWSQEAG